MAWQFPNSISKTDGTLAVNLSTTDDVIVAQGILVASDGTAMRGTGIGHEVRVFGSVLASSFGIQLQGQASDSNNYDVKIESSGFVFSDSASAVTLYGVANKLANAGEIDSNYFGVYLNASTTGTTDITNTGIIRGDTTAIARSSTGDFGVKLVNSGLIEGAKAFGSESGITAAGNDRILNTGTMVGEIRLDGGDDNYNGVNGHLTGTLYAGEGADSIRSGIDNDTLYGDGGADGLSSGAGADILYGGEGNDKLNGGTGADKLTGDLGADQFIFSTLADSTVAAAGRDMILDFSRTQIDRINLSPLDANTLATGNQGFDFIGTSAFHKSAGELRYEIKGGDTFVYGDVKGDGKADFSVVLDRSLAMQVSDFVL